MALLSRHAATLIHRGGVVFLSTWLALCCAPPVAADAIPRIAIVIDDLGNNLAHDQRALNLPAPITASILPLCRFSKTAAQTAQAKNLLVIAHLPMQSMENAPLGPGGLSSAMSKVEMQQQLNQDMDSLPGASGASNHMGSALTTNRQAMSWIMQALKARHARLFLDSRTSAQSVAADSARNIGLPTLERDVFFDHDRNSASINKQFDRMLRIARTKGNVIAIGHPYPETMEILEQRLPQLAGQGYQLVRLDALLKRMPQ